MGMEYICDDPYSAMMFINIYCKILAAYSPSRPMQLSDRKRSLSYSMVLYLCFQAYVVYIVGQNIITNLMTIFVYPIKTYLSKTSSFYYTNYYELIALTVDTVLKYIEICIGIIFFYSHRPKIYILFLKFDKIDQKLKMLAIQPRYDQALLFSIFFIVGMIFVVILQNRIFIVYPISFINEAFYFDIATDSAIAYLLIILCSLKQKFAQLNNYITNDNFYFSNKSLKEVVNLHYRIFFCCEYTNYLFKVPIALKLVNMFVSILLQTFYLALVTEKTLLLNLVVYPKFVFSFILVIHFARNLENQVRILY